MERVKRLGRYQKGVLIFMTAMILVFFVIYNVTIGREGFEYKGAILVPNQENGNTVYSGKIKGKPASFIVYADNRVEFQYADKIYDPYTVKEDPTAIPKDDEMRLYMKGVELRKGEDIIFRGGILDHGDFYFLFNENGDIENIDVLVTFSGVEPVEKEDIFVQMEPSASDLLKLMYDPEIIHKGDWLGWLFGMAICVFTAFTILFADEIFRWELQFQIRDVDRVEPSDWEVTNRYIGWTVMPIFAMIIFIYGLQ